MVETLTPSQARRIAVAAQGLDRDRPRRVDLGTLTRLTDRLGLLQIDSVNVLARAHVLPVFARLGPYDTALLTRMSSSPPRRLVETWAHEASLVPPAVYGDLAWWREGQRSGRHVAPFLDAHRDLVDRVRGVLRVQGPRTSRQVQDELGTGASRSGWWEWGETKRALEVLLRVGEVACASRTPQFERRYDLAERVVPSVPTPPREEAVRSLVRRSVQALGIGTARCVSDYYRLPAALVRPALTQLVDSGEVTRAHVPDWGEVYVHAKARRPRRVAARALLAPFDPLVFERNRLLALYGMHYRIGIYTPRHLRSHGYYVLPFLLGEHLVARVDLKADRRGRHLVVQHAHLERPGQAPGATRWPESGEVVEALARSLTEMAQWLGLQAVAASTHGRGDLLPALRGAVG
ncbi:winged helix-turn-helix domain-containing protein [Serinibacter salmoneus]|uniref:Winged helix-turn-helix domain-containing protein n=1 Tax=Serinibacter salmoneus TaxID=556530 RepID=A0A2A9D3A8_9MICO|nr:crosslink repair DNA glycosylase YcaQ family protein [Serinibacter salmoneus]PFG20330.1 hypothetical protein ATL40_1928 [Serinibacter salmoneus]